MFFFVLDNACGVGDLENYPYLYFAEPETNVSATICVAACPSSSDSTLDCYINSAITTCSESEIYSTSECIYFLNKNEMFF